MPKNYSRGLTKGYYCDGMEGMLIGQNHATLQLSLLQQSGQSAQFFPYKKYRTSLEDKRMTVEEGHARTQCPQNRNYVVKLSTFGIIVGVSLSQVQWKSLTLGEPPS